jgi:hypothetical protein
MVGRLTEVYGPERAYFVSQTKNPTLILNFSQNEINKFGFLFLYMPIWMKVIRRTAPSNNFERGGSSNNLDKIRSTGCRTPK